MTTISSQYRETAFVREFLAYHPGIVRLRFRECPTCQTRWHVALNFSPDGPDVVIREAYCSRACEGSAA